MPLGIEVAHPIVDLLPIDMLAVAHALSHDLLFTTGPSVPVDLTPDLPVHSCAIHDDMRQVKYLNNIVEQDHRAVKRVTRPMLGFKLFVAAQNTLVGIELMHMIKKRQRVVEEGNEGLTAAEQFYALAA
jgi:transposase-like protein